MFKHLLLTAICATALSCGATTLDFGKITHWAGEGDARAALVMLFDGQKTAQVWGFRWNSSASKPSGSDMVKAIAGASTDFDAMIQWTNFGYTLSGAGFSFDHAVMNYLRYDFEGAIDDGNISFGYYTPNTGMGQTGAPGAATQEICNRAIEEARKTHIIEHPLSHREYGYSAYDYDHWQLDANAPQNILWRAGWYKGYWSYWVGDKTLDEMGYSGLGMSSVELQDGAVNGWAYYNFQDDDYGSTEIDWNVELDYDHLSVNAIQDLKPMINTAEDISATIYTLSGAYLGRYADRRDNLPAGIYIVRTSSGIAYKVRL